MLPCATGIEYLYYLFHIHDLGRETKIDNFFPHLIMSSVLLHAGQRLGGLQTIYSAGG